MGGLGCTLDGHLNDQKFSAPMPWIGIYIVAASLACLVAMAADLIYGFRHTQFWFPCRFFSINATSLTLIAAAVKLSVDLNTSMPSRCDQLAKLSSTIFVCTIMANSMPSLGTMGNEEIFMNIMALGILVITLIVNICIQLATGAIFLFWKEHAFVMFIMLVLLVILSFSALTVPTTKRYLEFKYSKKYELVLKEAPSLNNQTLVSKLRENLTKYWMMAYSSSPQFVMGRSVTCTASGALCLVSAMILGEAMVRSFFLPWSLKFCNGESDYKWSTTIVLVTQTIAVGVGTIAPACRWLFAIRFRCPYRGNKGSKTEFKVERYWIQRLEEMKECPLTSAIFKLQNRHCRRIAHDAKNRLLDLCIALQTGIVSVSKWVRFVSIFSASYIFLCCDFCRKLKRKFRLSNTVSSGVNSEPDSQPDPRLDLSRFVLHLEGEEALVDLMIRNNYDATKHWFHLGTKRQPKYLIKLLDKSSQGFRALAYFDSDQVPSLGYERPPNSWALPVVTLTSIALALPNIDRSSIRDLRCGVNEGLLYVQNMEKYLDTKADLTNIKKAAEIVWTEVELYHKWLGLDLRKVSLLQGKSANEVLEELAQIAKDKFLEYEKANLTVLCLKDSPLKWPIKLLASNSMYRISKSLLLNCERSNKTAEKLFEDITVMISDILGACMTNLQQVISVKCFSSAIEERERSVRHAIFVLGKIEEILKILEHKQVPNLDTEQMACIDEWRLLHTQKDSLVNFGSSPLETDTPSSASTDVYIGID
ncbi:Transmembrane protein [Parasponia andersonii]|uniref:Transmembrane protein n=1 Tax=Parasponia andersonii TaxID=3476 RepID=A0A2P5AVS1_PARAD|nr:Transmembrane protein [Parasponia andersonii]